MKEDAPMSDVEHKQPQDDATVEITDIDSLDGVAADSKTVSSAKLQRSLVEPSAHRHRLQLVVTAGIVVLALLVILGSTAPVRELVSGVFIRPAPTPVPTLAPGVDLFYVQGNPPWGQLSIDGKAIAHLPRISYPPLRLSRGRHILVWKADPFLLSSCTVSVPASYATDTCRYNQTMQLDSGLLAYIITFSVSLTLLPTDQRAALIQAAQEALDAQQSTAIVQPGELYVLAPNDPKCRYAPGQPLCYATARQPLKATLSFQLDANEASDEACIDPELSSCTFSHQNCHLFCPGLDSGLSAAQAWDVFAAVLSKWQFATLDGRVLARDVPDNSLWDYATGQVTDESLVPLGITWDSLGWHVTVSHNASGSDAGFFDPACTAAQDEVQLFLYPPADASGMQWQYASGSVPAVGCIALGSPQQDAGTTATPSPSHPAVAYCLHRFGVNLAANELAQRYWPYLPVADAYEQLLAQQLAALVSGPSS